MPSFCVVSDCELKYNCSENISLHKFPFQNPDLLNKWIQFTNRDANWKPSRWSSICSRHFLPSDYRESLTRKCLKRSAVPSITIQRLDFAPNVAISGLMDVFTNGYNKQNYNLLGNGNKGNVIQLETISKSLCRLCARIILKSDKNWLQIGNFEIMSMILKCFPSTKMPITNQYPTKVCSGCQSKLKQFSSFIDTVLKVQEDLIAKIPIETYSSETDISVNSIKRDAVRQPFIKQEPTAIKVKQEIVDINKPLYSGREFGICYNLDGNELENEAFCEFCDVYFINNLELKQHIRAYHMNDAKEVANNCEIMEIITLEDAFINLTDTAVEEDEEYPRLSSAAPRILKVENITDFDNNELALSEIYKDHNYPKFNIYSNMLIGDGTMILKQEKENQQQENLIGNDCRQDGLKLKCPNCLTSNFFCKSKLNRHMVDKHRYKICSKCKKLFKNILTFLKHTQICSNKNRTNRKRLQKSILFVCAFCKRNFQSKLAYNNHKRYICPELKGFEYPCRHCGKSFPKWILMRQHSKQCVTELDIFNINKVIVRADSSGDWFWYKTNGGVIEKHNITKYDNGNHVCTFCDRTYGRRTYLLRHFNTHRPIEQWDQICNNCTKTFDKKHDLIRHYRLKECSAIINQVMSNKNQTKLYVCSVCGLQFQTFNQMKVHETRHSGIKSVSCELCNKKFPTKGNLIQHRLTHSVERHYQCKLCTKEFKRKVGLDQHIRGYHEKLRPHTCPVCNYRFALKGDMRRCKHSNLKNNNLGLQMNSSL